MKRPVVFSCLTTKTLVLTWMFILVLNTGITYAERPNHSIDEQLEKWLAISRLADKAFHLVEENKYEQARETVLEISERLLHVQLGQYLQYVEQANILMETVTQAKGALTQVRLDENQVYQQVLRMRLAINAVSHTEKPLWINFYHKLAKDIADLKQALTTQDRDQFYRHLNRLFNQYEFIRPAIAVSHPPQMYNQLDSLIVYLDRHSAELWQQKEQTAQLLDRLESQIRIAFFQESGEQSTFILLMVGMSVLIVSVLSYAGWKKYRGEQEAETVPWRGVSRV
ncbi:Sporulation protein YpjB [Caldalkalibacillus thermarum TA2.A1]|uniref:Sporulation protein YpjB n=1 Tax=Caldalkalibacillus thermarum (strain TA2.A1) TaxID=986075 RepID=F5L8X2_CALTT|nr:Sporulation protein YpjB [Caldalkalibacillus thermarum]EGL82254.1 Sporulation protein YpjB [Caldalkalibacillus thermarum TA2.A1]QZT32732.1 sporulation protein YpjB [Caldalkalibacillus thermarum TA2.A1]